MNAKLLNIILHENKNYWSNSEKPYTFVDITKRLKNN